MIARINKYYRIGVIFLLIFSLNRVFPEAVTFPRVSKDFLQYLPADPIVVEAGAYKGWDTLEMSKAWPKGTIYAFEPVPYLFSLVRNEVEGLSNVFCFQLALSNFSGHAKFYVSGSESQYNASSSLLPPKDHLDIYPQVAFLNEIDVTTVTLDDWAEQNNIDHIDFMWLDMQGYEPVMLMASPKILSTVKVIYTEVSLREMYKGCILYPEFRGWLEREGFIVVKEYIKNKNDGDVLFIKKEYLRGATV